MRPLSGALAELKAAEGFDPGPPPRLTEEPPRPEPPRACRLAGRGGRTARAGRPASDSRQGWGRLDSPLVEPEDAIGPGPFIYIALPAGETRFGRGSGELPDLIPVNATSLLREWEAQLDPVIALHAPQMLKVVPDWIVGDTFVEPTTLTMFVIRRSARERAQRRGPPQLTGLVSNHRSAWDYPLSRGADSTLAQVSPVHLKPIRRISAHLRLHAEPHPTKAHRGSR